MPEAGAAQALFHAESLTTLALLDGRVFSAERSAAREISRTLDAVPGLPDPPRFRARLSVQVQIEDCKDSACRSSGGFTPPQAFAAPRSETRLSNIEYRVSNLRILKSDIIPMEKSVFGDMIWSNRQ